MAPLKKSVLSKSLPKIKDKENSFKRGLSDFQVRVRRRESLRNLRVIKVRIVFISHY